MLLKMTHLMTMLSVHRFQPLMRTCMRQLMKVNNMVGDTKHTYINNANHFDLQCGQ